MDVVALIPAAGSGTRMGTAQKKPYLILEGKPVVVHTLLAFERCALIKEIILIVSRSEVENSRVAIVEQFSLRKVQKVIAGGVKRQDSVWEGLKALQGNYGVVMVHDGVRPFVSQEILHAAIHETTQYGATVAAVPVKDTIKIVSKQAEVVETVDRSRVWAVQTPQTFKYEVLQEAYEKAYKEGFYGTDDASLVERLGVKVRIIPGSYDNIKITTPSDLALAEAIIKTQSTHVT